MKDALGDRMKGYEAVTRVTLPRRTYTVLRVDGRSFHTYTRGMVRPFDTEFTDDMNYVAQELCKEVSGAVFAFVQSDEISVLVQDFGSLGTQPWLGGVVGKWQSISAACATAALLERRGTEKRAMFDARVFTLPDAVEVANYFIWRQKDAVRNSISMTAQAHFSHRDLQGKSSNEMQEMLFFEKGINWNDTPYAWKRGRVAVRLVGNKTVTFTNKRTGLEETVNAERSWWSTIAAPHFVAQPNAWLARVIPVQPDLQEN